MKKPGCLTAGPHSHHTGFRRQSYATSDPCPNSMFWLDMNLPLSDEFEIEKQVRYIQGCTDLQELRHLAVELLRFSTLQARVSSQLVLQAAEIEADMIGLGEPTAEHHRMAEEILAQRASS